VCLSKKENLIREIRKLDTEYSGWEETEAEPMGWKKERNRGHAGVKLPLWGGGDRGQRSIITGGGASFCGWDYWMKEYKFRLNADVGFLGDGNRLPVGVTYVVEKNSRLVDRNR